jgi:hypothetical protein
MIAISRAGQDATPIARELYQFRAPDSTDDDGTPEVDISGARRSLAVIALAFCGGGCCLDFGVFRITH